MMLSGCEDIESCIVGQDRQLSHFVQHLLGSLGVSANRAEPCPILERAGHCGKNEEHEFHYIPPRDVDSCAGVRAAPNGGRGRGSAEGVLGLSRSSRRSPGPSPSRTMSHRRCANGESVAVGGCPVMVSEMLVLW